MRHLWLLEGDRLRRFHCAAAAWSDADLAHTTDELGQAWLDVSSKARLDDFAADLAPLRQLHPAEDNGDGSWRPGVWRRDHGDPFGAEETRLLALIGGLRGLIVDIGAGPIRYLQTLSDLIVRGHVRYLAVEPDLPALERTAAALPGALLTQGIGEQLPVRTGQADHVLMLRSFNHLHDVPAAFAEATRVARPGASLLVVDNVAFGLLRTPSQLARAHAVPVSETPFEHYRNANADAALAAIEHTGQWTVTEVRAVVPGAANQWLVRAQKR
ncbi:MAG: class I SAM-dependent methyltransferase [Myxococcales bacterium]|nr:class I SAM-dependent methyltransferase [Myxococcales bacterium]